MIYNYIAGINEYGDSTYPLVFFSYVAGGFGNNIDSQLKSISDETAINGSAMCVSYDDGRKK